MSFKILLLPPDVDASWPEKIRQAVPGVVVKGHCQLIEKIPNKWVKYLTTDLLTPCILVHECQGKSQEIGYLPLS